MLYRYTIDNILSLLQTVGTLYKEQIVRFFAPELPAFHVVNLLNQLVVKHILIYDAEADTFSFIGAAHYEKNVQERVMKAFWVLAATGSADVIEIVMTRYPTQFMFITNKESDNCFDVTVVNSEHEALVAQRMRSIELIRDTSDVVSHIAVLRRPEDANMLKNAGFDMYCVIDPKTKEVKYYNLEEN